jgi:CPA1 family monovalent cation:H+ antiporter
LESQPVRLGTGYFFGEIALVTARPRTANVTALSYCDLLALYTRDFERLLDAHPTLRKTIMTVAAERLAALDSTLEL